MILLLLAVASPALSAPLFEQSGMIDVELIGPVRSVTGKTGSLQELPFTLRIGGVDLDIGVRVRGKSRAQLCEFPPLRLDFSRSEARGTPFEGQGRLKLVTHCRGSASGRTNTLEEYLAYRIFGLLSEVSYRVRLLRITYTDTEHRAGPEALVQMGFVIEPKDQLAKRVGGVPLELAGVALGSFDPGQVALVYVFQYLIGNTDWSFVTAENDDECCHNGDLLDIGGKFFYVPYDFDLAGIVNAAYATPLPEMRLRSVRQRRYRGFCTDPETLRNAVRQVNARQKEIFEVIRHTPGLEDKYAEQAVEYLAGYFDKAENEDKLLKSFERSCIDP
jgi:hypothetical protein